MKHLIIAEKPSVAAAIAHAAGAYEKIMSGSGRFYAYVNDKYYIAYTIGHLYGLGDPTAYGYSEKWAEGYANGELPMFPDFLSFPINDDKDELRAFLNALINSDDVDEIICATDAAREGELIFREIYKASGSTKPVKRFWTSSLTDEAINAALVSMKPLSDYDNLYRTAKVRNELDWIFGMNLSRLYSVLDSGCTHRVGRVVTPLLGLIVKRDTEISRFVPKTTYKLLLNGYAESVSEFSDAEEARTAAARSQGQTVTVRSVRRESKTENRPRLYSLTRLQQDANDRYGITADQALSTAQELYEKKLITYPRTDSEVISEDMREIMEPTVKMLGGIDTFSEQAAELISKGLNLDKRVVNNGELTDHHAIIPTLRINPDISGLTETQRQIYDLIASRMLMALDEPHKYDEISYEFSCDDIIYTAAVKNTVQDGWKKWSWRKEETSQEIPVYSEGEYFAAGDISVKERRTKPLKHYTDATLLSVMENIHNQVEDADLKNAVKKYGIGTSATRAEAIKKLIDTGYVERVDKNLIATEFGTDFVRSLPPQILSVERTAQWEQMFSDIEKSGADDTPLYEDIRTLVENIIEYEKTNTARVRVVNKNSPNKYETVTVGKCPRCGMDVVEKKIAFCCSSYINEEEKGCGFSFFKKHRLNWFEGEIMAQQAEKLLEGKSVTLTAVEQNGEKHPCEWQLDDIGEFVNIKRVPRVRESLGKCPRCGMDVVEGKLSYGCSSYRGADDKGCGFMVWKQDKRCGFTVTVKMARELLNKGETTAKIKTIDGEITRRLKLTERESNGRKYVNLYEIKD